MSTTDNLPTKTKIKGRHYVLHADSMKLTCDSVLTNNNHTLATSVTVTTSYELLSSSHIKIMTTSRCHGNSNKKTKIKGSLAWETRRD